MPFELAEGRVTEEHVPPLVQAFHDMHERIYTIKDEDDTVEFTTWKVRAVGREPSTRAARRDGDRPPGRHAGAEVAPPGLHP